MSSTYSDCVDAFAYAYYGASTCEKILLFEFNHPTARKGTTMRNEVKQTGTSTTFFALMFGGIIDYRGYSIDPSGNNFVTHDSGTHDYGRAPGPQRAKRFKAAKEALCFVQNIAARGPNSGGLTYPGLNLVRVTETITQGSYTRSIVPVEFADNFAVAIPGCGYAQVLGQDRGTTGPERGALERAGVFCSQQNAAERIAHLAKSHGFAGMTIVGIETILNAPTTSYLVEEL